MRLAVSWGLFRLNKILFYLKVDFDFGAEKKDRACFYYSLDGERWCRIGDVLQMTYDWPDFMGYRFGLFLLLYNQPWGVGRF